MVAFIIKHYLIFDYPVETPCVITVLIKSYKSDIGLLEFGILIVDYEYDPFLKSIIEKILYFCQFFLCIISCELCEIPSIFIKITVKIVEPVVLPVEIVVLNSVFTKSHLEAIIKLTIGICKEN